MKPVTGILSLIIIGLFCMGKIKADEIFPEKPADNTQKKVILSPGNGETKVTLNNGLEFWVRLEGNPTTGYVWTHRATRDLKVVIPDGKEQFVQPDEDKDGKRVGQSGYFDFPFKTVTPGKKTLVFIYHRPWEKDVEPARKVELTITVNE